MPHGVVPAWKQQLYEENISKNHAAGISEKRDDL
jgi:hypothetical protein